MASRRPPTAASAWLAAGLMLLPALPAAAQGAALGSLPSAAGMPSPVLREVVVAGAEIRLGDIFAAAGGRAEQVIANAPAPGDSVVLDVPTLSRLARAYGIDWQPRSPAEQVIIGRVDGIVVDSRILAEPIRAALANRGVDVAGVELTINGSNAELRLPETASLRVERLSYRPPARAFAAVLTATDGDRLLKRICVSGEIRRARAVPVLARPVARGETLVAADLRWLDADEARLPRSAVIDAEAMVGLTVRRDLKPGQVIQIKDLAKPVAVEKNAAVTLILSRPGIQLTARGRALADAGIGDAVQVANLQSNLVVAGIVTAPGTVTISGEGTDGVVSSSPPAAKQPRLRTAR